jgi:hypothetical protein
VHVLHTVPWPSVCCICPYAPFIALSTSMLHLSLCSIQYSGHFYATPVPIFHTVQWPSLCYTCPYFPYSAVTTSMLHLSLCSMQFSGNLCVASVHMIHSVQLTMCLVPLSLHYVQCNGHFRGASSHAPYNVLAISLVANP